MPRYWPLKFWKEKDERARVIDRLLALRRKLAKEIPERTSKSLLLATWNIRDFDSNKFGHGHRQPEAFHYIAEIISSFDLVAVQEVNDNLKALKKVMRLLGDGWDYIVTDTTEGAGGNTERLAFVYDTRKVTFRNIAGEIVLPKGQQILSRKKVKDKEDPKKKIEVVDKLQFARTPYVVAFQAGWFKFSLCTVHIYFGKDSGEALKRRIAEIAEIAKFLSKRADKDEGDFILLGDFNIVNATHKTMKALTDNHFRVAKNLTQKASNLKGDKHYDQIAFKVRRREMEEGASGVFRYERSVYRNTDDDYNVYFDRMPPKLRDIVQRGNRKGQRRSPAEQRKYYANEWRTWQMSDHMPMWVQLNVDFTEEYLGALKAE